MSLPQTYSRRQRESRIADTAEVYRYDLPSQKLRNQLSMIIGAAIGPYQMSGHPYEVTSGDVYEYLVKEMREEVGEMRLGGRGMNEEQEFLYFLGTTAHIDNYLDSLEMALSIIAIYDRKDNCMNHNGVEESLVAIQRCNARMAEAAWGYRFEGRQLYKIDSEYLHSEVIVPVLRLIADERFTAADEEYRAAHKAYREADFEVSLIQSAKAFESTLKVIGRKRGWSFADHDAASKLVQAAVSAGFLAPYFEAGFESLRKLLESIPTPRNKSAGHGAGEKPREVRPELAGLLLHQVASAITFLVESDASQV